MYLVIFYFSLNHTSTTDLGSFQVTLTYLPFFGAICASVSSLNLTEIPESEATTLVEKSSLLHCLFEGDTGRTSPNSLVSYHIRKRGGDIFSSAVRQYGFPYKWVQRVCGIADNVESPETKATEWQVETSAESIEGVVKVIKRRFKCQAHLSRQLVKLSKGERERKGEGGVGGRERERRKGREGERSSNVILQMSTLWILVLTVMSSFQTLQVPSFIDGSPSPSQKFR